MFVCVDYVWGFLIPTQSNVTSYFFLEFTHVALVVVLKKLCSELARAQEVAVCRQVIL